MIVVVRRFCLSLLRFVCCVLIGTVVYQCVCCSLLLCVVCRWLSFVVALECCLLMNVVVLGWLSVIVVCCALDVFVVAGGVGCNVLFIVVACCC